MRNITRVAKCLHYMENYLLLIAQKKNRNANLTVNVTFDRNSGGRCTKSSKEEKITESTQIYL